MKHLCGLIFLLFMVGCGYNRFEPILPESPGLWVPTRTLAELVEGDMKGEVIVRAVVATSDSTGNFYKEILVVDTRLGAVLSVRVAVYSSYVLYPIGTMLAIRLTGERLDYDQGILSVSLPGSFGALSHYVQRQGADMPLEWRSSTIEELNERRSGSLVELSGVYFPAAGDTTYSGSVKLKQLLSAGYGRELSATLYTSRYATFASDPLPSGVWRLRAIVFRHEDKVQLRFASAPYLFK